MATLGQTDTMSSVFISEHHRRARGSCSASLACCPISTWVQCQLVPPSCYPGLVIGPERCGQRCPHQSGLNEELLSSDPSSLLLLSANQIDPICFNGWIDRQRRIVGIFTYQFISSSTWASSADTHTHTHTLSLSWISSPGLSVRLMNTNRL